MNKSMFKRSMIDAMKNNCFNWFFSVPKLVYANQTGQNKQTSSSCFRRTACSTARFPFLSTSEAVSPSGTIWRCKYSGSTTGFLIKGSRSGRVVAFLGSFSSSCRIEKGILNIFSVCRIQCVQDQVTCQTQVIMDAFGCQVTSFSPSFPANLEDLAT